MANRIGMKIGEERTVPKIKRRFAFIRFFSSRQT